MNYITEKKLSDDEWMKFNDAVIVIKETMDKLGLPKIIVNRQLTEFIIEKITIVDRYKDVAHKI